MQTNYGWSRSFLKVANDGVANIGAKFVPSLCLCHYGVAQSARDISAVNLILVNFKDDLFHTVRLAL